MKELARPPNSSSSPSSRARETGNGWEAEREISSSFILQFGQYAIVMSYFIEEKDHSSISKERKQNVKTTLNTLKWTRREGNAKIYYYINFKSSKRKMGETNYKQHRRIAYTRRSTRMTACLVARRRSFFHFDFVVHSQIRNMQNNKFI